MKRLKKNRPNLYNVVAVHFYTGSKLYIGSYENVLQCDNAIMNFLDSYPMEYWIYRYNKRR